MTIEEQFEKFHSVLVNDDKCPCGSGQYPEAQTDYYGIYCGKMCDVCFKKKYRQDDYFDAAYAGESLDGDY